MNIFKSRDKLATRADLMRQGCQSWYDQISSYEYPGEDAGYLSCSRTHDSNVNYFTQVNINPKNLKSSFI